MTSDQQAKRAMTLAAIRQVRQVLKDAGMKSDGKHTRLIREFARVSGLTIDRPLKAWLIWLWDSGTDARVRRTEKEFSLSPEWRKVRRETLRKYGEACMRCGSIDSPSVDHIKPRSLFPDLSLDGTNLQVLCRPCNSSKSDRYIADYRQPG